MLKSETLVVLTLLVVQCGSQIPLVPQSRMRRGVAANVAASASAKSSHRSSMQFSSGPTKSYIDSFEDPQSAFDDPQSWSEMFMPEEKLVAQLLHRRSLVVRPNGHNNQSNNPVHVNITYNVVQILAFSQAEETLSISGWFTIKWLDPRLSWDPESFDNIREVNVPSNKLWIPDVGVMNGKSSTDFDFSAGARSRLTVNSEGEVTWLHGAVLDTTCPLDVSFFPFDYQTCFLILTPWQSSEQQLLLRPFSHGSAVDNSYLPNSNVSEWEIQSVHFASKKYRSDLNVTYQYVSIGIHLKRQPLYFVVLVLVPFSMLSALACLIFTLDDTGDRLSVALSLVLSMTMYVVIVSSNAPRSMRTLPVLGIFLLDQLGLLSIATVLAVINNKLYSSNELINWQDWVYVISGTGESKGSDGASFARRYSARFQQFLKQRRRATTTSSKSHRSQAHEAKPSGNYYPRWWNDQTDCAVFESNKLPYTDSRSVLPAEPKRSWLNGRFRSRESNTSVANSDPDEEDSLSIRLDANYPTVQCLSQSPIKRLSRQCRSLTDTNGIIRIAPFQYGHHPLCNNINSHSTGIVDTPITNNNCKSNSNNNNNKSNNALVYQNSSILPPTYMNSKDNDQRINANCSSCANKFLEPLGSRSPWVEPLRHGHTISSSPGRLSSRSSESDSTCTSSSSSSSTRMFKTTITATAAAALAATRVLNEREASAVKRRVASTRNVIEQPWESRSFNDMGSRKHRRSSNSKVHNETPTSNAAQLAAAAVSAAFQAAAIVNNKSHRDTFSPHFRCNNTNPSRSAKSRPGKKSRGPFYPYRKLAARLDCLEMIAYLLLSTINAIVCLLIMPRFTQDPLPPKHWIM